MTGVQTCALPISLHAPPDSRLRYLWHPIVALYFATYVAAFLTVFSAGLLTGAAFVPYDNVRIPIILVGCAWLLLIGLTVGRSEYQRRRQLAKGLDSPPDSPDDPMSDNALRDPSLDRFRRHPFAERLAHTLATREGPNSIVVALDGSWGEGKTTVLNFVEGELETQPNVACVRFNPWYFEDEASMLLRFFQMLAQAIGTSVSTQPESIGGWLQQYASILASVHVNVGVVQFSPGDVAAGVGKVLSSPTLSELRARIEGYLRNEKKRIVIMVDDIDRLDRDEIQTMFKLVRLLADFPYTVYVLAFDTQVVSAALEDKYPDGSKSAGRRFLEKIVQLSLQLPAADAVSLRQLCFECVDKALFSADVQLTEEQSSEFARHFIDGLERSLKTPRLAKGYANALSFVLPLLKDEVNTLDLLLLEGLKFFHPVIYDAVRKHPDAFLEVGLTSSDQSEMTRCREIIEGSLAGLSPEEAKSAMQLLKVLFPRSQTALGGPSFPSGWDRTWEDEKRVASSRYFDRYFAYCVPEGDVPDQEIAALLEGLETLSVEHVADRLRELSTSRNVETMLYKLRLKEDKLDAPRARRLASAVSMIGDTFPDPLALFSFTNPFHQAAILVAQLVKSLPAEERVAVLTDLVRDAKPLSFAAKCFHSVLTAENQAEVGALTEAEEQQVGQILAVRIENEAAGEPLYHADSRHAYLLLHLWSRYGTGLGIAGYLTNSFSESPNNVIEFLECFLPTSWGGESNVPRKGRLDRGQYDIVAGFVSPDAVLAALRQLYAGRQDGAGDDESVADAALAEFKDRYGPLNASRTAHESGASSSDVVAGQFVFIYDIVQNEARSEERSEEHTSELQSHSFISYAVFCLKKKKNSTQRTEISFNDIAINHHILSIS